MYTWKFLTSYNFPGVAKKNAEMHYNRGEDIYDWMLDQEYRQYSCAIFKNSNESLEQAQTNKLLHIAKKLDLYGYNSFLLYALSHYESKNLIYSLIKIKDKYYLKSYKFDNLLVSKTSEITIDEILSKLSNDIIVCPKISKESYDRRLINLPKLEFVKENYEILIKLKKTKYLDKNNLKPLYLI